LGDSRGGDAAWATWAIRSQADICASGEGGDQCAQASGAAAGGGRGHLVNPEMFDRLTDEPAVAVAAGKDDGWFGVANGDLAQPEDGHGGKRFMPEHHDAGGAGGEGLQGAGSILDLPARRLRDETEIPSGYACYDCLETVRLQKPFH
jgi:hypothetical protein